MQLKIRDWLAVIPLTLILVFFLIISLGGSLLVSLGYAPALGIDTFPTTSHLTTVWSSPGFVTSIWLTFYYASVATLLALSGALIIVQALRRTSPQGSGRARLIIQLPLVLPYLVGVALAVVLFSESGVLARISFAFGWVSRPSDFPDLLYSQWGWGVIWVYVWKQLPFMTLAIYTSQMAVPEEHTDAARALGAKPWQAYWFVNFPQLLPGILSACLICFAFNIGAFEAPLILGGGHPETLSVRAWRLYTDADINRRPEAMTILLLLALLVLGLIVSGSLLFRRYARARPRGLAVE